MVWMPARSSAAAETSPTPQMMRTGVVLNLVSAGVLVGVLWLLAPHTLGFALP